MGHFRPLERVTVSFTRPGPIWHPLNSFPPAGSETAWIAFPSIPSLATVLEALVYQVTWCSHRKCAQGCGLRVRAAPQWRYDGNPAASAHAARPCLTDAKSEPCGVDQLPFPSLAATFYRPSDGRGQSDAGATLDRRALNT